MRVRCLSIYVCVYIFICTRVYIIYTYTEIRVLDLCRAAEEDKA